MAEFFPVGTVDEFTDGEGRAVEVNGRMVAVFRKGTEFYAIDDFCPHMGASLAAGYLEGESVTCPWHAWRFCIRSGAWEDNPRIKVDSFPVRVQDGQVEVAVADQ